MLGPLLAPLMIQRERCRTQCQKLALTRKFMGILHQRSRHVLRDFFFIRFQDFRPK